MRGISTKRAGLGSEHPRCDQLQLIMILVFFAIWGGDAISFVYFGYSTVLDGFLSHMARLVPGILSLAISVYVISQSHKLMFEETTDPPHLVDSGVYARVRHPMYLGILLFCLGCFFLSPSLLSLGVWIGFFIFYDRMATYEEHDLMKKVGEEYRAYQQRVPKWVPRRR